MLRQTRFSDISSIQGKKSELSFEVKKFLSKMSFVGSSYNEGKKMNLRLRSTDS